MSFVGWVDRIIIFRHVLTNKRQIYCDGMALKKMEKLASSYSVIKFIPQTIAELTLVSSEVKI